MNTQNLENSNAVKAVIELDTRALKAALLEGPAPTKIEGKDTIYWISERAGNQHERQLAGLSDSIERTRIIGVLELLLSAGCDVNGTSQSAAPITALMKASMSCDIPVMRRLIQGGADVNAKTTMKYTALHFAAAAGSLAGVRLLVEKGADVDAQIDSKDTALHLAASPKRFNKAMIKELYQLQADFNIKNTSGRDVFDVIALSDPRLAQVWRHKPGRDALEKATAPALNSANRRPGRL